MIPWPCRHVQRLTCRQAAERPSARRRASAGPGLTAEIRCSASGPWDLAQKPAPRSLLGEVHVRGAGYGGKGDHPPLQGEGRAVGDVQPLERQRLAGGAQRRLVRVGGVEPAGHPAQPPVGVGLAARLDHRPQVRDLQDRGVHLRVGDERPRLVTPLDQPGGGQGAHGLACCHPGAAILGDQGVLGGQAVAGRPDAGADPRFEVGADAARQARGLHASSLRRVAA